MRIVIHIDGRVYAPAIRWERTRQQIVGAARTGGGFVVLLTAVGATEVFVSEASRIYAEQVPDEPFEPEPDDLTSDDDFDDL